MNKSSGMVSGNIILASASPRRKMLFEGLGIPFRIVVKEIEEVCPGDMSPKETAICLAKRKADEFHESEIGEDGIIITADTIVELNNDIIGKPGNREEAISMLQLLSGNMHIVHTGVCIKSPHKEVLFSDTTKVWFAELSYTEIEEYVERFMPYDKAGAYGIQEWIGYVGVTRIEGSFFNVMGLPTHRLYEELKRF